MSDDCLPTHVKEMRNFIAYAGDVETKNILNEYSKTDISPMLQQACLVVNSLDEIGLERLALLFEDRSHAEIILENCISFRKRFVDRDFQTTELIAEAFVKIFEKVKKDRFELIGLTEGQISVLTGNVTILSESYEPILVQENPLDLSECLDKMQELIDKWESHRELPIDSDINEGIEIGLMRAADDLKMLFNEYKSETQLEHKEDKIEKPTLIEDKGAI